MREETQARYDRLAPVYDPNPAYKHPRSLNVKLLRC